MGGDLTGVTIDVTPLYDPHPNGSGLFNTDSSINLSVDNGLVLINSTLISARRKRAIPISCSIDSVEILDVIADYPGLIVVNANCENQLVRLCQGSAQVAIGGCTIRNQHCSVLATRPVSCDAVQLCGSDEVLYTTHLGCTSGSVTFDKVIKVSATFVSAHRGFSFAIFAMVGFLCCMRLFQCGLLVYFVSRIVNLMTTLTVYMNKERGLSTSAAVLLLLCFCSPAIAVPCYDLNFVVSDQSMECGSGACYLIADKPTCICPSGSYIADHVCVPPSIRGFAAASELWSQTTSSLNAARQCLHPSSGVIASFYADNPLSLCVPHSSDLFSTIIDFHTCLSSAPAPTNSSCIGVEGFGVESQCSAYAGCHSDYFMYGVSDTENYMLEHKFSKVAEFDTAIVSDIVVRHPEFDHTGTLPLLMFDIPERFLDQGICGPDMPDMIIRTRPSNDDFNVGDGALYTPTASCLSSRPFGGPLAVYQQPHLQNGPLQLEIQIGINGTTQTINIPQFFKIEIFCVNEKFGPTYQGFGLSDIIGSYGSDAKCPVAEFAFHASNLHYGSLFRFGSKHAYLTASSVPGFNDLFIYGHHFSSAQASIVISLNTTASSHDGYLVFNIGPGPCRAVDMALAAITVAGENGAAVVTAHRTTNFDSPSSPKDSGVEVCAAIVHVKTHVTFRFYHSGIEYAFKYNPTSWFVPAVVCGEGDHPIALDFVYSNGYCFNLAHHFAYMCGSVLQAETRTAHSAYHVTRMVCLHSPVQCVDHESDAEHRLVHDGGLVVNGKHHKSIPTPNRHSCYKAVITCSDQIISRHVCGEVCGPDDFWRKVFSFPFPLIVTFGFMSERSCYELYGMLPYAIIRALVNVVLWCLFAFSLCWFLLCVLFNLRSFLARFWYSSTRCARCLIEYNSPIQYQRHLPMCYFDKYDPVVVLVSGLPLEGPGRRVPILATREFPTSSSLYSIPGPVYFRFYYTWLINVYSRGILSGRQTSFEAWYHLNHHKVCNKYYPFGIVRWLALIGMYLWRITVGNFFTPRKLLVALVLLVSSASAGGVDTVDVLPKSSDMTGHPYSSIIPPINFVNAESCHSDTTDGVVCDFAASWKVPLDDISYSSNFVFVGSEKHELGLQVEFLKNRLEYFKEFEYCTSAFRHVFYGRRMCGGSDGDRCAWSAKFSSESDANCSPLDDRVPDSVADCPYVQSCDLDWWQWDTSGCGCFTWGGLVGIHAGSVLLRRYSVPDLTKGYSCIWRITSQAHRFTLCVTLLDERKCVDVDKTFADIEVGGKKLHFEFSTGLPDVPTHINRLGLAMAGGVPGSASIFDAHAFAEINSVLPGTPGDLQFLHFGALNSSLCTANGMKIPTFDLHCDTSTSKCWTYLEHACLATSTDGRTYGCDESNNIVGYDVALADPDDYFAAPKSLTYYRSFKPNLYQPTASPTAEFYGLPPSGTSMSIELRSPGLKLALAADKTHLDVRDGVRCVGKLHAWSFIECTASVYNPAKVAVYDRFYSDDKHVVIMPHSYTLNPGLNVITLDVNSHTGITTFMTCASFHAGKCGSFKGDITHEFVRNMTVVHDPYADHIYGKFEGFMAQVARDFTDGSFILWVTISVIVLIVIIGVLIYFYRWMCLSYTVAMATGVKVALKRRIRKRPKDLQ